MARHKIKDEDLKAILKEGFDAGAAVARQATIDLENAVVRLVGCMHPAVAVCVPEMDMDLLLCDLCGAATRDRGTTWVLPGAVQALADASNALAVERTRS